MAGNVYHHAETRTVRLMDSFQLELYPSQDEQLRLQAKEGYPPVLEYDAAPVMLPVRSESLPEEGAVPHLHGGCVLRHATPC